MKDKEVECIINVWSYLVLFPLRKTVYVHIVRSRNDAVRNVSHAIYGDDLKELCVFRL